MPFGRSLLQRESLLRVSGEERSPEILISFQLFSYKGLDQ